MNKKTGVLIIGHGSKMPYNKEVVTTIAQKLDKKIENTVESGFMELVEPNIPQQVNKLKQQNMERIIVVPAFLSHGIHTKVDIPTILRLPHSHEGLEHSHHHHHHHHDDEREAKSELIDFDGEIIYLDPFESDDKIVDIVEKRLKDVLKDDKINNDNTGILLIGHGSSLPYGKIVLNDIAEKTRKRLDDYIIELSFMRIETPSIPESFEKLQSQNFDNIIVLPVFLADGLHTKSDIPLTLGLEAAELDFDYPKKDKQIDYDGNIIYLDPLKAEDEIIELIENRIVGYI
ncbi:sirohydrochlorin nickelochelatase [Methanosphaera sp. ISO3-F5]|uniref:sirohydrochlorin nickelochelatase n=1 Tax=Methanosphaera sp. ISO3-F5 TaxID=1452353 RepID=UPI002B25D120|nr:sirohydrochlorin nickelochelatase [Methanosphaera sp. ISO3-F5]WQH63858.1 sirohydrochlorin nickelochelatase [Methanosphaera sp. ISO3-F5]